MQVGPAGFGRIKLSEVKFRKPADRKSGVGVVGD